MQIKLTESLSLEPITMDSYDELCQLMERIYPPAYKYLWDDDGQWYLQHMYNKTNVKLDIEEENSVFYFVNFHNKKSGILKLQYGSPYPDMPTKKALRLHRIYLSEEVQGKGISGSIMDYVLNLANQQEAEIVWLDCMDTKEQALRYYMKHGFQKGTLSQLEYELLHKDKRGIYLMWKEM